MKIEFTLEKEDWDALHDVAFSATGEKLNQEELDKIWKGLTDDLKGEVVQWGLDDTCVRDNIYTHIQNNYTPPVKEKNFFEDYDLSQINGREIIEFLNKEIHDNDDLCDISITYFTFDKQEIKNGQYVLHFTGIYNNWGTDQGYGGNRIRIKKDGIQIRLEEPFEGDGTDDAIEEVLVPWLKTHKFDALADDKFIHLLKDAYEMMSNLSINSHDEIQKVIDKLVEA